MAKYKKKRFSFKSLLSLVLVIGTVVALGAGITAFAKNETKTVNKIGLFEVGSISEETGEYVESKSTLYTKNAIECQGLTITPDFDNKSKYQIFWYNEDDLYFAHTEVLYSKYVGNVPECARYCRIVVFPEAVDENGKEIKDFSIKFYEKQSYVKSLKIEVNKNQVWTPFDYYAEAMTFKAPSDHVVTSIDDPYCFYEDKYVEWNSSEKFSDMLNDHPGSNHCVVKIDCSKWSEFKLTFNDVYEGEHEIFIFYFDADGNDLQCHITHGSIGGTHIDKVPQDAAYVTFSVYNDLKPIIINGYLPR